MRGWCDCPSSWIVSNLTAPAGFTGRGGGARQAALPPRGFDTNGPSARRRSPVAMSPSTNSVPITIASNRRNKPL